MKTLIAIVATAVFSGCMSVPDRVDLDWAHVSHPLLGAPFGPSSEEDTLDVAEISATWNRGPFFMQAGLGKRLADGGFYGDDFIFNSRVGMKLWSRND
jgi:hypothetical protein